MARSTRACGNKISSTVQEKKLGLTGLISKECLTWARRQAKGLLSGLMGQPIQATLFKMLSLGLESTSGQMGEHLKETG